MLKWKQIDRMWIAVLLIALPAIWPFLSNESLPHNTDAELHIFRLAELARMWEGGILYPRWAANFYYGYGYPIFNYYAPLTYYVGLLFNLLPGFDPVSSVKAVFILGQLGSAVGMYGFVRSVFGKNPGLIAATSYLFSPYILYIDPHARGVLPETFSFAVFPLALWSFESLIAKRTPVRYATTIILTAAIILTHNLMAMVFGGLLFAWFLWRGAGGWGLGTGSRLTVASIFPVGVALSAFFWLPMVMEQDAIQIATVIGEGSHYDYRNHFLTAGELFAHAPRLDWSATEPHYLRSLGVGQWLFGLLGAILLFTHNDTRTRHLGLFFLLMAVFLIFLMLPASQPLWNAIPLLPFLQFPWRLLGATNFMLAVLAGLIFQSRKLPVWMVPAAALVVVGISLPLTQVKPWPTFGGTTALDVLESELAGRWRGTTSTADFVPSTVVLEPREDAQVVADFQNNLPPERLNRFTLGNADVETEILSPIHTKYHIESDQEFVLRLFTFYFPGWEATIDGVSAEIQVAEPEGFITIPVPAGSHTVELQFKNTPIRRLSWLISGIALASTILMAVALRTRTPATQAVPDEEDAFGVVWVPLALFVGVFLVMLNPSGQLRLESAVISAEPIAEPAEEPIRVSYAQTIDMIGYDAPELLRPGRTHEVTLYWRTQQQLEENYAVFVHILDENNNVIAQSDKLNPGDFPTEQWPTTEYVRDPHYLTLPADLPAGDYRVTVGLWVYGTGPRLAVVNPPGEWYVLREFTVKK